MIVCEIASDNTLAMTWEWFFEILNNRGDLNLDSLRMV